MKEHYEKVRRFVGEILNSNRNNTVKIKTTRLQDGGIPRFQRMYVCYDALKKAWKSGCRPVLGLERGGSNCIFPVAMAVVERENYDSWKWFLELLVEDLDLGDGFRQTLISDQQKVTLIFTNYLSHIHIYFTYFLFSVYLLFYVGLQGLDKAIRELLPQVEHRFCTRHLSSNLTKVHPSNLVKNAFWKASLATHPQAFKSEFKELERASKGAWERMKELPPSISSSFLLRAPSQLRYLRLRHRSSSHHHHHQRLHRQPSLSPTSISDFDLRHRRRL